MSETPEILWPAMRQYRHNTDNSPYYFKPKEGFVAAFDYDEVVKVVTGLQTRVAELEADKLVLMQRDEKYCNTITGLQAENTKLQAQVERIRAKISESADSMAPGIGEREPALTYRANMERGLRLALKLIDEIDPPPAAGKVQNQTLINQGHCIDIEDAKQGGIEHLDNCKFCDDNYKAWKKEHAAEGKE